MKKLRVYVDTSVIGGCFDDEFMDESRAFINMVKCMGTYNQLLKKGVKKKERKYQKDYSHKKSQEVTKSAR